MPRDKKTEDAPDLLEWELAAVGDFVRHGNRVKAFTENHPSAHGWSTENARRVSASQFFAKPNVKLAVLNLRGEAMSGSVLSLNEYLQGLKELKESAEASGNLGAAVQAWKTAGQASGHHETRPEEKPKAQAIEGILERMQRAKHTMQ